MIATTTPERGIYQKAKIMMFVGALAALSGKPTPIYITLKQKKGNRNPKYGGAAFKQYDVWSIDLDYPQLSRSRKLPEKRKIFKGTLLSVRTTENPLYYRAYVKTSKKRTWEFRGLLATKFDRYLRFWLEGGSIEELEKAIDERK